MTVDKAGHCEKHGGFLFSATCNHCRLEEDMTNEAYKDELNAAAERGAAKRAHQEAQAAGIAGVTRRGTGTLNMHAPGGLSPQEIKEAAKPLIEAAKAPLQAMLDERGSRYGKFVDHAETTQALKLTIYNRIKHKTLAADQLEALEMIAHKIGRIVCGDPDFEDSWRDIAGYATLVADRLKGEER